MDSASNYVAHLANTATKLNATALLTSLYDQAGAHEYKDTMSRTSVCKYAITCSNSSLTSYQYLLCCAIWVAPSPIKVYNIPYSAVAWLFFTQHLHACVSLYMRFICEAVVRGSRCESGRVLSDLRIDQAVLRCPIGTQAEYP